MQRTEAPRLAELRMRALESRVDADLRLGRHRELVAELRGLVGGEPLREGLHGQLMLALYRCGRQAEALGVFRGIDQRLRGELGISPGPELQHLHQRILTADPSLTGGQTGPPESGPAKPEGTVPRELPPSVPGFTGRKAELTALTRLLDQPAEAASAAIVISAIAPGSRRPRPRRNSPSHALVTSRCRPALGKPRIRGKAHGERQSSNSAIWAAANPALSDPGFARQA